MKMIEVFDLMAKDEIKEGTKLKIYDNSSIYIYKYQKIYKLFLDAEYRRLEQDFEFDREFLNLEVELSEPEEKKYLIKVNVRGLAISFEYLNYYEPDKGVVISSENDNYSYKTHFTKSELQSIQPVREFLEDMEGKYELIGVDDNETD